MAWEYNPLPLYCKSGGHMVWEYSPLPLYCTISSAGSSSASWGGSEWQWSLDVRHTQHSWH